jgi:hypothetical protein
LWNASGCKRKKRHNEMNILRSLAIVLMTAVGACKAQNRGPEYGKAFNEERLSRGVYLIPEDAILFNKFDTAYPTWIDPANKKNDPTSPRWYSKQLEIKGGILIWETDDFFSGKKYLFAGDKLPFEELSFRYSYADERKGKDPWWCYVNCGPNSGVHTLEEAKRILRGWGIDYTKNGNGKP